MEKQQLFLNRFFLALSYSKEKRWRHSDVIDDLIRILFVEKYLSYPKVILYKIWLV